MSHLFIYSALFTFDLSSNALQGVKFYLAKTDASSVSSELTTG